MATHQPDLVVHLVAQAGARYSIDSATYVQVNLVGIAELLEAARVHPPRHMVRTSNSSVGEQDDLSHDGRDNQLSGVVREAN